MTIRMLFVLLLSLFTTRAVLAALGVEDYGIYNIVCGFVSMFAFLNSSMAGATQRFYNYELGLNGDDGVRCVYNAALWIHISVAIIVFLFAEIFGLWYLNNKLIIPEEKLIAAFWIFQFSLTSLLLNIINVPYSAVIMAYERMDYYAKIGVIDAILKLLITYALYLFRGDRLIIYGFLFMLVSLFDFLAYRIYAKHKFNELRYGYKISKGFFKKMLSFAGWNIFGSFAYVLRSQGINLVLNAYFGPILNAAKGIADQVNAALQGFSGNVVVPARPQIIQSYAKGDQKRSISLTYSISKIACIIFLLMSLPLCVEVNPILHLWLGQNIPEHSASFIVITLVTNTWGSLIAPISALVHATGKMRFYQILSSASNLLSIPLALLFLKYNVVPEYVFYALFITMLTNHIAGLISVHKVVDFSILDYLKKVVMPLLIVILLSSITTLIPHYFVKDTVLDFMVVFVISILSTSLYAYFICFDRKEKTVINQYVSNLIKKFINA